MNDLNKKEKEGIKEISNKNDPVLNYKELDKIIESSIENKLNHLLETLPENIKPHKEHIDFYDLSLKDIYKNTLQSIIDIINDITKAYSDGYIDNSNYINVIIDILSKEERRLYIGITLVFLSFIIYFIDGASV